MDVKMIIATKSGLMPKHLLPMADEFVGHDPDVVVLLDQGASLPAHFPKRRRVEYIIPQMLL